MPINDITTDTLTSKGTETMTEATPSLKQQVSDAEFTLMVLKAFSQDHNYMLRVDHFSEQTGMSSAAFKKRLQRVSKNIPELEVFKATESTKHKADRITIVPKSDLDPPRKPSSKATNPTGMSKSRKPCENVKKNAEVKTHEEKPEVNTKVKAEVKTEEDTAEKNGEVFGMEQLEQAVGIDPGSDEVDTWFIKSQKRKWESI